MVALALRAGPLLERRRRLRCESKVSSRWRRFRLGRQRRQACLRLRQRRLGLIAVLGVRRLAARFARYRALRHVRSSGGLGNAASRSWRRAFRMRRLGCWVRRDVMWTHSTLCRLMR